MEISIEVTQQEIDALEQFAITPGGARYPLFDLYQKIKKAADEQSGAKEHDLMRELSKQGYYERGSYDWNRKMKDLADNGYLWKLVDKKTITFKSVEVTESEVLMVKIAWESKHKADPKEYNNRIQ